jgi:predicted GNAT family acetyltransferase
MLYVRRFADPARFLARAEPFLIRAESENVLMLGICGQNRSGRPVFGDSSYLATVDNEQTVVACALRTPPHKAIISRADRGALELLVDDLISKYKTLPAVVGPEPTVSLFAELWSARTGATVREGMRQRLFETRCVLTPVRPSGQLRAATDTDMVTVAKWVEAFVNEAGLDDPSHPLDTARERIRERSMFIWDDGQPVSMAGWAGRTSRTARVNFVYTPPEFRRRGYASACVADLTQQLLGEGLVLCCLYTDLSNLTSNKIYQAVGYRPVCDVTDFRFTTG